MEPRDPRYQDRVREIFTKAAFMNELGVRLTDVGPGWCESELELRPQHLQQDEVVHAAVLAAIADHTAGAAAGTLVSSDQIVLTLEFKINLLRPARGEALFCRSDVLKPGKSVTVCESEVFRIEPGPKTLVAKSTVTLSVVQPLSA